MGFNNALIIFGTAFWKGEKLSENNEKMVLIQNLEKHFSTCFRKFLVDSENFRLIFGGM